jgi:hypothetical protein
VTEEPGSSLETVTTDEPGATLEPVVTEEPVSSPEPSDAPWRPAPAILIALIALAVLAVAINFKWVIRLLRKAPVPITSFTFELTLSAPLGGEKVPTVSMEAEIDSEGLSLSELAEAALPGRDFGRLNLSGIQIHIGSKGVKQMLMLINNGSCEISDSSNIILTGKKIWWKNAERLSFADEYEMLRLDVSYNETAMIKSDNVTVD